jgi:hypothetical protein
MVARALFGNLGDGTFGFRCSRPGYDVNTATKGELLYDTSGIVFQKVLSGETIISQNRSTGNYNVDGPPLPSEYSSYSNLHMWANLYFKGIQVGSSGAGIFVPDSDLTLDEDGISVTDFKYGVDSGVVKFETVNCPPTNWNVDYHYFVCSSWAVFNALMS